MSDHSLEMEQKRQPAQRNSSNWLREHAAINPAERSQRFNTSGLREEPTLPQRDFSQVKTQSAPCAYTPQRCPFGGACETCPTQIQAKLIVNQPGDPYEQEADRVANIIMENSPDELNKGQVNDIQPLDHQFQRLHTQHAGNVQRQETDNDNDEFVEEDDEEETPDIQMKSLTGQSSEVTPQIENSIQDASNKGQPLPKGTRSYYEERFGRNFSDVRIHNGPDSWNLNNQMRSYAFTYRNHIWLGPGQHTKPSRLLAHELVHVVQQVEPPMIQESQIDQDIAQKTTEPLIQRFLPYWEPYEENGTTTHNTVLPQISREASIFVEAPVPNADRISADYGKRGIADLYDASTTIGLYFSNSQTPVRLRAPSRLRKNGAGYQHNSLAAPKVNRLQSISDLDRAPTSIKVGDLKPSHGTIEAQVGKDQINHYKEGFQLAAREVNELVNPPGESWNLTSTDLFSTTQLNAIIPAVYRYPASAQTPRRLVLKQNSRVVHPVIRATGKLILEPHEEGILNYVWVPDPVPTFTLPARLRALGEQVRQQILNPILRPPVRASVHDTFELGQWRTDRRRIQREFRTLRRSSEVRDATSAALVTEAHRAIQREAHLSSVPDPSGETLETARTIERLEFWTSPLAGVFGSFRRTFGRTFVKIADAYERMRERFGNSLRRMRSSGGSGLPGAAIKAIFSVLKMTGVLIINRTVDVLGESIVQGIANKLTSLIPEDNIEELRNQIQVVEQLKTQLSQQSIRTAEQIVESVFPNYQNTINEVQNIASIVGDLTRYINWVKWGVRAIACVSPPALGCLWALAQAAIERLAAVVVQSCWFQEKITPYILRLGFVRDLPRRLAQLILQTIRGLLPQSFHDLFADVSSNPPSANESIECDDEGGTGRPLTDDQLALLEMQERIGEEKFEAFLQMVRSSGAPAGVPLRRAEVERISEFITESGISTEEMRRLGRNRSGRPVELDQFLEQIRNSRERSPLEPVMPVEGVEIPAPASESEAPPSGSEPQPEAPVTGQQTEPSEGQGQGEGPGSSSEEPGEETSRTQANRRREVLEANSRPDTYKGGARLTGWTSRIARVQGQLIENQQVLLDIRMSRPGSVRIFRNLEVRVDDIAPSEDDPQVQEYFLEITRTQGFDFGGGEEYTYLEGGEFIYRRRTRSRIGE